MPCPCILPSFHCPTYLLSVRHVYVPKPWIRPNCTCMTIGRVWPPTAGMADAHRQAARAIHAGWRGAVRTERRSKRATPHAALLGRAAARGRVRRARAPQVHAALGAKQQQAAGRRAAQAEQLSSAGPLRRRSAARTSPMYLSPIFHVYTPSPCIQPFSHSPSNWSPLAKECVPRPLFSPAFQSP